MNPRPIRGLISMLYCWRMHVPDTQRGNISTADLRKQVRAAPTRHEGAAAITFSSVAVFQNDEEVLQLFVHPIKTNELSRNFP